MNIHSNRGSLPKCWCWLLDSRALLLLQLSRKQQAQHPLNAVTSLALHGWPSPLASPTVLLHQIPLRVFSSSEHLLVDPADSSWFILHISAFICLLFSCVSLKYSILYTHAHTHAHARTLLSDLIMRGFWIYSLIQQ